MKKNYSMFLALFLLAGLAVTGCKKNSSGKSKTELLTQGTWKIDDAGIDTDKDGDIDLSDIDDCALDNVITINANGTGSVSEGADVCDGSEATSTFTWNFTNDETAVNISIEDLGEAKILSLTDTEMKLYKEGDFLGVPVWGVFIFKH